MIYLNSQIYSQLEAASVDIELEKKDLQSFVYLFDEGGAERKQVSNATRISRNMKKKKKKKKKKFQNRLRHFPGYCYCCWINGAAGPLRKLFHLRLQFPADSANQVATAVFRK